MTDEVQHRAKRPTYSQDWPAYNEAMRNEPKNVPELLHSLCDGIHEPPQVGRGNRRMSARDKAFLMAMHVYNRFSTRKAETAFETYHAQGYIQKPYRYAAISKCFDDPAMTPILVALIEESAAPLAGIERSLALDSTGHSGSGFGRWAEEKHQEKTRKDWVKVHVIVGCYTNIVIGISVTHRTASDSPELPGLLDTAIQRFSPLDVVADKGYLSRANQQAIVDAGAACFIPFKSNSTAANRSGDAPDLWRRLYYYFQFQHDEFLRHYHARSNVEAVFSGVKRLYGGSLRSKTPTAQTNEALAKYLCWNLSCLNHEIYKLGVAPIFWQADAAAGIEVSETPRIINPAPPGVAASNWEDVEVSPEWGGSAAHRDIHLPTESGIK